MDADEQKNLNETLRAWVQNLSDLIETLDEGTQRSSIVDAASSLMDALRKPVANRSTARPPTRTVRVSIPLPAPGDEQGEEDAREALSVPAVNLIEATAGDPAVSDAQPIPGARAARIRAEANAGTGKPHRDNT